MRTLSEVVNEAYEAVKDLPEPYAEIAFKFLLERGAASETPNDAPRPGEAGALRDDRVSAKPDGTFRGSQDGPPDDADGPNLTKLAEAAGIDVEGIADAYEFTSEGVRLLADIGAANAQAKEQRWVATLLLFAHRYAYDERYVDGDTLGDELHKHRLRDASRNWTRSILAKNRIRKIQKAGGNSYAITPDGEKWARAFLGGVEREEE